MRQNQMFDFSRRSAIKTIAAGAAIMGVPLAWLLSRTTTKQKIIVRDAGGIFSEAYAEILYKPFTRLKGIEVIGISEHASHVAQFRAMFETKKYPWNMAEIGGMALETLTTGQVYLERHELESDPIISKIPSQFMSPYGVGTNMYSMVLAYRTDAFKGRLAPQSWKDFWDVDKFPGRRGLYKSPFYSIEQALLATGVPPNCVYPCDLDQAFRSLDKIKPHISVWYTSGPQSEQLLKSGEVDLMPVWTARAQTAINAGAPIAISWEQNLMQVDSWAIAKGAPNVQICREFIKFASEPKQQALLAQYGISPTHPDAFEHIDATLAEFLPSHLPNLKKSVLIDTSYWVNAQHEAIERFNAWLLA